ncbi:hypothetical protein [Serratia inhibens]|uniref:hypothetical protein n=1 Tax=Serratia inhibens TaxID=2338073 RepID=UPI000809431A|nr:hypothetical protein [Serratia inhibens]ANS42512.1 hypothetical protein Q5A_010260 [Serratia inhibens PRI-2C]
MSTAWIRAWFTFATVYTGIDLSKEISEQFFAGSRWAQLVGVIIMTAIVWSTRAKLKEMK